MLKSISVWTYVCGIRKDNIEPFFIYLFFCTEHGNLKSGVTFVQNLQALVLI